MVLLSADVFASAVETESPQGIAATVLIPGVEVLDMRANPGVFLFLENLQDPGNLGTLIRTAEAFGVRCLYVTPGTVNTWNPKTVRASAGSVFRVRVYVTTLREFADSMSWGGIKKIAATSSKDGAVPSTEADLHAPCVLMIGNEGAGLSEEALTLTKNRVHIPCAVESLNAAIAGSVLMYEAARQNQQLFLQGVV
jgi:TrmH family RNA methyltransferase